MSDTILSSEQLLQYVSCLVADELDDGKELQSVDSTYELNQGSRKITMVFG